jgi:hypothetical protein
MSIAPNRLVVLATPVIFAPLAGAVSVWAAKTAGVDIDADSLQAVFIAGATIAFAKAGLWLKGWQDWEKRAAVTEAVAGPVDQPADLAFDPDEAEGIGGEDDIPEEDRVAAGV